MKRTLLAVLFLVTQLSGVAIAQDTNAEVERGVARISVINGEVSVRRADSGDWVAAAVNGPLVVPDSIYTGAGSRAEVQLDYANMVRLAAQTEVRFSELENLRYQLQISRGTVTYSVLRDSQADVDLSTPNVSVRPIKKGRYRITVRENGITEVTVRKGKAEIYTPSGTEPLGAGKTMIVRGSASQPEFQIAGAIPKDDWDHWNASRDKELSRSRSYRYVSRDIYGAEDLDGYGEWVYAPPYGWVWSPRVAVGWAPYRYGRWSWIDWYGWSWISYDPWGWAPYHYGRWFYNRPYGWCWWPGSVYAHHYWSPALVAFVGWNSYSGLSVGVGIGFGNIGWVPLAPYEAYHPWYGRGWYHGYHNSTYIDNSINIVNNVDITNIYRNARINNGVTAVNAGEFGRGSVRNVYRTSSSELRRANLIRGQLPVVPRAASLRMADRKVRASGLPSSTNGSRFYTRRTARHLDRVPFSQQQRALEQVSRRAFASTTGNPRSVSSGARSANRSPSRVINAQQPAGRGWTRATTTAPAARNSTNPRALRATTSVQGTRSSPRAARTATPTRATRTSEGWRRFGEPQTSGRWNSGGSSVTRSAAPTRNRSNPRAIPRSATTSNSGWRHFGQPTRVTRSAAPLARPSRTRTRPLTGASTHSSPRGTINRAPTTSQSGTWRRFTTRRSTQSNRSRPAYTGQATSRSPLNRSQVYRGGGAPVRSRSYSSPGRAYQRTSPSRSLQISPPIVRQRSTPSYGRTTGSRNRSFGSSIYRGAPSVSRGSSRSGSWSAPRMTRSQPRISPRSSGSFGGGSSRSAAPVSRGSRAPSRSTGRSGGRTR